MKGLKKIAMGRRFHSEPVRGKKEWKTGQGVGSVPGACSLCALLVLGSEWRKKLAGFMSTTEAIAPSHKLHCPVSSCCYIFNTGGPGEATADDQ